MAADFYVDILEPKQDPNESSVMLSKIIAPLYQRCWSEEQEPYYKKSFDLQVQLFLNLWFTGGSKIFIAYEKVTERPLGFLLGILFRPMQFNAHVFQVQEWYSGGRDDMEKELFAYAFNAIRFIGCDEFWVGRPKNKALPDFGPSWRLENSFSIDRFVKAE